MNHIIKNVVKKFKLKTKKDNRKSNNSISVLTENQTNLSADENYLKYLFKMGAEYMKENK